MGGGGGGRGRGDGQYFKNFKMHDVYVFFSTEVLNVFYSVLATYLLRQCLNHHQLYGS